MKAPVKVLATALILASTSGLAFAKNFKGEANFKDMPPPCPPPAMLKDGFYLGGQVGYDAYRVRTSFNGNGFTANPTQNVSSWVGGLFLGYGQYLTDLFYLGGEVFGTLNNGSETVTASDATIGTVSSKFEANNAYGLALLPGVRLNDTSLGYIRLGYNWANLKASETSTLLGSTSKSNTSGGFNLGVGIETLIVTNWSVRGEFSHTWYNNFTSNFGTKYSPSDNLFMLGLLYHFS